MFKSTTLLFTVAIAFYVTPLHAQQPQGVNLAEMQDWNIVIADDAIASEVYAAEEFQEFFRQASGLKLPIVHKITRWDKHVFIGPGKVMHASPAGFSVEELGPEDLHIVVRDNNIAIAGGRPRGTLYGVYTFLEDYLGVRFLTHDHTHVPAVGQQQLIGPLDRIYRPPFANYRNAIDRITIQYPVFAVRHRNNASHDVPRFGGVSPFGNTNHSLYRQAPFKKYGKEHPEYFGLWDGKRVNDRIHTHYCLTNIALVPIVSKAVLEEIEHPPNIGRKNFSVSQMDTMWQYCQCDECAATDGSEKSHMGALLEFVNAVAEEIAKTHPDVDIGTLSYGFSRPPPKMLKPRPNVEISLPTMGRCNIHAINNQNCPRNVELMRDLKGWSRICRNLYSWDYYFGAARDALRPYPDLFTIKPNINTLLAHGVKGVFMQFPDNSHTPEMSDLRHYLMSRLLWNPKLNDREVVDEFLNLHYGKAAPPIRRFINLLHGHYAAGNVHHSAHIMSIWNNFSVDESVAAASLELFKAALDLAENETIKARVEQASICAYRAVIDPIWKLKKDAAIDPALAGQMRPLVKKFFRLCDKYGLAGQVASDRQRIEGIGEGFES